MKTRILTICIAFVASILIPARSSAADISLDIYINSNGDAYYDTACYESDEIAARILTDRVASLVRLSAYEWERLFEFYLDEIRYSRGGIMSSGFITREDLFIRHLLRTVDYRLWRNHVARRARMTPPPPHRHVPAPAPALRHSAPPPAPHRGKASPAPSHGNGGSNGHNAGPGNGRGNYERGSANGGHHNGGAPGRGGDKGGHSHGGDHNGAGHGGGSRH